MNLCLDAVIVVAHQFTAEAVGVLQLQTAFGVEPVLQTTREVCALPTGNGRVAVVVVGRSNGVDTLAQGYRTGEVGTTAVDIAIFACQELTAQRYAATGRLLTQHGGNLQLATKAHTVATIVIAFMNGRIPSYRSFVDSMSATLLCGGHQAELPCRCCRRRH